MNYILKEIGFTPFFEQAFYAFKLQGFSAGRIAAENKNHYSILTETGILQGELAGKLLFTSLSVADLPKTGDWVVISVFEEERKAIIHSVLPRKTTFSRKVPGSKMEQQIISTNIDLLFIVQSLDAGFNLRRLERYLVMAHESRAMPVIVLNKADLCNDLDGKMAQVKQISQQTPVIAVSCLTETALDAIRSFLKPGITIAFTGSSGVGKSTLINCLSGQKEQETGAVRETDAKGRHTTTRREMILLPEGSILIDTPGMRELQLWNVSDGLEDSFADISITASQCHFSDCTHTTENKCAILVAVNEGRLSWERYKSYRKLQKELAHLSLQQDKRGFLESKQKNKRLHKQIKQMYRNKDR